MVNKKTQGLTTFTIFRWESREMVEFQKFCILRKTIYQRGTMIQVILRVSPAGLQFLFMLRELSNAHWGTGRLRIAIVKLDASHGTGKSRYVTDRYVPGELDRVPNQPSAVRWRHGCGEIVTR